MKIERIFDDLIFDHTKIIDTHEIYGKKNDQYEIDGLTETQKQFSDRGLFSKRLFGDMDSLEDYKCSCSKLTGKFYLGTICDRCGDEVVFTGLNVNKSAWIDLSLNTYDENGLVRTEGNGIFILRYISYLMLEKVIGRENLKNIIHTKNTITISGEIDLTELEEFRSGLAKHKYWYVGLEEFYNKYTEILEYYFKLNGSKDPKLFEYLNSKEEVFTDKIPVISVILRPARRTSEGLKMSGINIRYQNILKNLNILREASLIKIIRDLTIEEIQAEFFQLSTDIMKVLESKNGFIRDQICGTRINFSARNIISPADMGVKINELVLPYLTFLELYRFEIIHVLRTIKNCSFKDAEVMVANALIKFDEEIYLICKKMITDNEVGVLLNRNPTIAYGSILYLRVVDVKSDIDDITTSLHNGILTLLAGDYDGDVLNIVSIKDSSMRDVFRETFSPMRMIISDNDGKFNNNLNLERDQVLGLNSLID